MHSTRPWRDHHKPDILAEIFLGVGGGTHTPFLKYFSFYPPPDPPLKGGNALALLRGVQKPSLPIGDDPKPIPLFCMSHLKIWERRNPHNRQGTTLICAWHEKDQIMLYALHVYINIYVYIIYIYIIFYIYYTIYIYIYHIPYYAPKYEV